MWHGAALTRVKKLPELKSFLTNRNKTPVKGVDENAIKEGFKALARKGVENGNRGTKA
jgi:hypothetical protein